LTVDEKYAIAWELAETNLWAGEIGEDSDGPANFGSYGADPVVTLKGKLKRFVRKVDSGDIHARLDQTLEDTRIV
jgi:hypothetical protein